jgi:hypothetical protein
MQASHDFHPLHLHLHGHKHPLRVYTYRSSDSPDIALLTNCSHRRPSKEESLESSVLAAFDAVSVPTSESHMADFFLIPARPACLMASGWQPSALTLAYQKAVESLPYFQISGGRDHMFVFITIDGPNVFPEWCVQLHEAGSIHVQCKNIAKCT